MKKLLIVCVAVIAVMTAVIVALAVSRGRLRNEIDGLSSPKPETSESSNAQQGPEPSDPVAVVPEPARIEDGGTVPETPGTPAEPVQATPAPSAEPSSQPVPLPDHAPYAPDVSVTGGGQDDGSQAPDVPAPEDADITEIELPAGEDETEPPEAPETPVPTTTPVIVIPDYPAEPDSGETELPVLPIEDGHDVIILPPG